MALTPREAADRVDARIGVLEGDRPLKDLGLSCVGTDVPGPMLASELRREQEFFLLEVAENGARPAAALAGALLRIFWLGYEYGKDAER